MGRDETFVFFPRAIIPRIFYNATVSGTPLPATLYPPDDTPDAQRGFLLCRLTSAIPICGSLKPECLVGGKVTVWWRVNTTCAKTRPVLSHLLQGVFPLPSFPLVAPIHLLSRIRIYSSSPLSGFLSFSRRSLHFRFSLALCILHLYMHSRGIPVLPIYSSCRFFCVLRKHSFFPSSPLYTTCLCTAAHC